MSPRCPQCGQPASASADNRHRPFCSARCQQIDLHRWLEGDYAVPGEPAPDAVPGRAGEDRG
jgi:endogenous inhibitor of DNA gyrase (YacG/DUF329 family)